MKRNHQTPKPNNQIAFQGGSYSLAVTAMVLALLVVLNILAGVLPLSTTHLDISSSRLYSVTSNTKSVVQNLTDDVTIYWITQAGEEDPVLENLLSKYETLSDHISVVKKNPDIYPTFAEQYTSQPVQNNSLVVECGERSRYIPLDQIYLADMTAVSYNASFDGEGAITSAVDYVVNAELPKLYLLEGHGEAPLPDTFLDQLTKANMEVESLSLLNVDAIPEDAACLLLHAPSTDLSQQEADLLDQYTEQGGKLLVLSGLTENGPLPVLNSLLARYGVETVPGVVLESDRNYYAFQLPHVLLPELVSSPITDPLIEAHYHPVISVAQGLELTEEPLDATVTPLLTTSPTSYCKEELDTYDQEEGDSAGPFALAVDIRTDLGGQIVWFSSSDVLASLFNSYSSGANTDLVMNALASMVGDNEALAIRSKSLNYNYLTISESTASLLKVLLIGVFPLAYLGVGIAVVVRRKQRCRNHEPA